MTFVVKGEIHYPVQLSLFIRDMFLFKADLRWSQMTFVVEGEIHYPLQLLLFLGLLDAKT